MSFKITAPQNKDIKLPDLSYEQFCAHPELYYTGSSDVAYAEYLREQGMSELCDYNNDFLKSTTLEYTSDDGLRVIKFKVISDSDDLFDV